ncbi:hypothetical protein GE061_010397 [Apolygus lucorum]|uniref:Uncharacterized protein n=1 Tax=Apolygus lucorum TaxID=248454 RepID=A0A8S9Y4Y2_APOLU|nr:hypothetical protein GE061_010397 [Apolygus lucorum]
MRRSSALSSSLSRFIQKGVSRTPPHGSAILEVIERLITECREGAVGVEWDLGALTSLTSLVGRQLANGVADYVGVVLGHSRVEVRPGVLRPVTERETSGQVASQRRPGDHESNRRRRMRERRAEYARIQQLWKSRPDQAAKEILGEDSGSGTGQLSLQEFDSFWRPVLEDVGRVCPFPVVTPANTVNPSLAMIMDGPVTAEEEAATRIPQRSAPGPDGLQVKQ